MAVSDIDDLYDMSIELQLDTDGDRFPSFSTVSGYPSQASSFAFYKLSSSPVTFGGDRQPSIPASETSLLLLYQGTSIRNSLSPMTPVSPDMMNMVMTSDTSFGCTTADLSTYGMFSYHESGSEDGNLEWMAQEPKQSQTRHSLTFKTPGSYSSKSSHQEALLSPDKSFIAGAALESSLSRSMFHHHHPSDSSVVEHMTQWRPSILQSPPKTVAPSATFQSPAYHVTPSTPLQNRHNESLTPRLGSTPFSSSPTYSPCDQPFFVKSKPTHTTIQPTLVWTLRQSKCKGASRASRKSSERKESAKKSFVCTAEDCLDKSGQRKKFKRQEHLKRHQRTCHTGYRPHYCWVPGCTTKPFSRTDNLNSHLLKTHGKNSPAARNRYIATLDPKSGMFDIDYRGPFTDSGWPIRNK